MSRLAHLVEFYGLPEEHAAAVEPCRLRDCSGVMRWPKRGVYYFFESGECRSSSGAGPRVVRVGTHAVSVGSRTTLWHRLSQHRGTRAGTGNHRGSVFRKLVGTALASRHPELAIETWGKGQSAAAIIRGSEVALEEAVSRFIGAMPFLWVAIADEPSKRSQRAYIETNSIALLSNAAVPDEDTLDRPSPGWLGSVSNSADVRRSGLWNSRDVYSNYDAAFLSLFARLLKDSR